MSRKKSFLRRCWQSLSADGKFAFAALLFVLALLAFIDLYCYPQGGLW